MTASAQPLAEAATFALERFAWDSPGRLELSGWFHDLDDVPQEPPVLVVHSDQTAHRLPAVPDSLSAPTNGDRWRAQFAWADAPEAPERAWLELGGELVIELPPPSDETARRGARMLEVRRAANAGGTDARRPAERLSLQADLLLAREDVLSLQAAVEHLQEELQRARSDVAAERGGRADDSERFRRSLAQVSASAEEALAAERETAERLERELVDARRQLRDQSARLAAFEHVAREASRQHSQLQAARAETEQLLSRLTGLRDTLAEERE